MSGRRSAGAMTMTNLRDGKKKQPGFRTGAPVRMKDIAEDMGLSTVTISKVLRGHSDISEETRRRVSKRMEELNYQPNLAARALITGRTWTIGLVGLLSGLRRRAPQTRLEAHGRTELSAESRCTGLDHGTHLDDWIGGSRSDSSFFCPDSQGHLGSNPRARLQFDHHILRRRPGVGTTGDRTTAGEASRRDADRVSAMDR